MNNREVMTMILLRVANAPVRDKQYAPSCLISNCSPSHVRRTTNAVVDKYSLLHRRIKTSLLSSPVASHHSSSLPTTRPIIITATK